MHLTEGFVNIKTVFGELSERNFSNLKTKYDTNNLLDSMQQVSATVINKDNIIGKKVLLKPNWVKHNAQPDDEWCLRTHDEFVFAALELVLQCQPEEVLIADAPIQGCKWQQVITGKFIQQIEKLSSQYKVKVTIKDFRRVIFDPVSNNLEMELNPMNEYIIFDTGNRSFLEPVTNADSNQFRVSQYNPDHFTATHRPGVHKYCIAKALFDFDIVISLPKVKTHQKSGITCALKNIVGFNGDKDYLPHHRIGGTANGGDSYPGKNILRYWAELALDKANRNKGNKLHLLWRRVASVLWKISLPGQVHQLNGAWHGNDTTWRMVMDLNMVITYGKADGTLADVPQRKMYHFCDGIIAGQGDGPLKPLPLDLGIICFSDDAAATDICMATLMNMDTRRIPLLVAAKSFTVTNNTSSLFLNGNITHLQNLQAYAVKALMPPGWQQYKVA